MPELTALQSVSTASLRRYLFSISQYCRSVSDLTDEDKLPPTAFHSCAEPPISLTEYILGIGRRLRFSRFAVLLASVYVARLSQRIGRAPSILSIHRLYAFSLLFACKTLGGDAPTDEAFAQNAGFPLSEVLELQAFVQRTIGRDAKEYDVEVENMHQQLEIASQTTLRSRIAVAVATAFQLQPPMAERAATFRNRSPGPQLSREPTPEPRSRDASPTLMPPALQAWPKPRSRENSPVANSRDSSLGLLSAPGEVASMLLSREPSFRPPTPSIDASPPTAPLSREGSIRPLSSRSREASGVFVMSPVVNSLLNTPRQPWDLRRSSDSQYLFGSGVSAVRGLRHGSKTDLNDISFMLPTQPEESLSQYPLPTFTAHMPQTLNADSESAPPPLLSVDAARHAPSLAPRPVFMVQRS